MRFSRLIRHAGVILSGAMLFQFPACPQISQIPIFDIVQTVFLGITAAGSLVIINNL